MKNRLRRLRVVPGEEAPAGGKRTRVAESGSPGDAGLQRARPVLGARRKRHDVVCRREPNSFRTRKPPRLQIRRRAARRCDVGVDAPAGIAAHAVQRIVHPLGERRVADDQRERAWLIGRNFSRDEIDLVAALILERLRAASAAPPPRFVRTTCTVAVSTTISRSFVSPSAGVDAAGVDAAAGCADCVA